MEVILTTITLTTVLIVVVVIGVKYHDILFANRGPLLLLGLSVVMVGAFIYFYYFTLHETFESIPTKKETCQKSIGINF